jgi:1-deoxy-D-xylulose-5-phosphate reductoisomerase
VVALTAGRNDIDLALQVKRFKPEFAALTDPEAADRLAAALSDQNIMVESGDQGQIRAATWPGVDIVVMAQVGFSGFQPLVAL